MNLQDNAVQAATAADQSAAAKRAYERTAVYNRMRAAVVDHVQRKLNINIDPPWQPDQRFMDYWDFGFDTIVDGVQLHFTAKEDGNPPNRVVIVSMYALGKPTITGETTSRREFSSIAELGRLIKKGELILVEQPT